MSDSLSEISEKIKLGEDSTIEFKEQLPHRDSLADEIGAFANARGGMILIGVKDNRDIVGIKNDDLDESEKTVIEVCRDSLKPSVKIDTEKILIENKNILKITVPHSLYVHESPNGCFRRQGSSKEKIPLDQLARLLQSRSQARIIRFDEQIVPDTSIAILSQDLYQKFISRSDDKITALHKIKFLKRENGKDRVSVAGLLMCCDTPDEYLYNSFICAVLYKGIRKDANDQINAQDFKGPIDQQIINAFDFVKRFNKVSAKKEIGREERPQYSMKAVFEAIVNAVVHRDYSKSMSKIRLFMFADRLELYVPGTLANTLTVDQLSYGQATRNERLSWLLSKIELGDNIRDIVKRKYILERRGEGVQIILNESERLSDKRPVYEMFGEELRLTIFAAKSLQDE